MTDEVRVERRRWIYAVGRVQSALSAEAEHCLNEGRWARTPEQRQAVAAWMDSLSHVTATLRKAVEEVE